MAARDWIHFCNTRNIAAWEERMWVAKLRAQDNDKLKPATSRRQFVGDYSQMVSVKTC